MLMTEIQSNVGLRHASMLRILSQIKIGLEVLITTAITEGNMIPLAWRAMAQCIEHILRLLTRKNAET
jgi:hypothetical protein